MYVIMSDVCYCSADVLMILPCMACVSACVYGLCEYVIGPDVCEVCVSMELLDVDMFACICFWGAWCTSVC